MKIKEIIGKIDNIQQWPKPKSCNPNKIIEARLLSYVMHEVDDDAEQIQSLGKKNVQLLCWYFRSLACSFSKDTTFGILSFYYITHLRLEDTICWWALISFCILSAYKGRQIVLLISFNNTSSVMLSFMLRITCIKKFTKTVQQAFYMN